MTPFDPPIYVARPSLPPLADFVRELAGIWDNRILTNRGPLFRRFERRLAEAFATDNVNLFNNGMMALQLGLQVLDLSGEVITTPFTFAASVNAIVNAGLSPVFADIEPDYFSLDPERVEALITPRTAAILAVHVYGFPCRLAALASVAERHGLPLIYDAAHAFGVEVDGQSIAVHGDLSMFSFHATKAFHSIEGGALVFRSPALKERLARLGNHGLTVDGDVPEAGTNAKLSEVHALMGLLMLDSIDSMIERLGQIAAVYRARLSGVEGVSLTPPLPGGVRPNHAFMPILVDPDRFGCSRDDLQAAMARQNVFTRRYFYPLLSNVGAYARLPRGEAMAIATRVSERVLSLPIYPDLSIDHVHRICDILEQVQRSGHRLAPRGAA